MGLKWSSLRRNKDIVPETTVPAPSTAHVPSNQARTHSVVEGILPGMNGTKEDPADSSRPASHFPPKQWIQEPSSLQGPKACRRVHGLRVQIYRETELMICKGGCGDINDSDPKSLASLLPGFLGNITKYLWPEILLLLEYTCRSFREMVTINVATYHIIQRATRLPFVAPWQQNHLLAATQLQPLRLLENSGICSASTDYMQPCLDFPCVLERYSLVLPDLLLHSSCTLIHRHSLFSERSFKLAGRARH